MITSASATASSTDVVTCTPSRSMPGGTSVGGPHTHTSAPSLRQQQDVRAQHAAVQQVADDGDLEALDALLVLADRERVEQRLRRVLVHAVAGVDDARLADARQQVAAPDEAWRRTIMSGAIASMFSAVSTSVSPLSTLDAATAMFSVSALSRFSAISNDVRVRVLGS